MGKKFSKSEKLDLILSELEKLRVEVKKLARDRAPVADQGMKAKPPSAARGPKKLSKRSGTGNKPDRDVPSKPVSVQAPQIPQPTSRTVSQVPLPPQTQTGAPTVQHQLRPSRKPM